jgi:hypothetical protein
MAAAAAAAAAAAGWHRSDMAVGVGMLNSLLLAGLLNLQSSHCKPVPCHACGASCGDGSTLAPAERRQGRRQRRHHCLSSDSAASRLHPDGPFATLCPSQSWRAALRCTRQYVQASRFLRTCRLCPIPSPLCPAADCGRETAASGTKRSPFSSDTKNPTRRLGSGNWLTAAVHSFQRDSMRRRGMPSGLRRCLVLAAAAALALLAGAGGGRYVASTAVGQASLHSCQSQCGHGIQAGCMHDACI